MREIFNEWEGMACNVKCHKSWATAFAMIVASLMLGIALNAVATSQYLEL